MDLERYGAYVYSRVMPRKKILLFSLAVGTSLLFLAGFFFIREEGDPSPLFPLITELTEETQSQVATPTYIEVIDSCGADYAGGCVNIRIEPSNTAPSLMQVRTGVVLPVASTTVTDGEGRTWYKVHFTEWIRYQDRVPKNWYVAGDYVRPFFDAGAQDLIAESNPKTDKRIVVDRSEQKLYAYDGDTLFLESSISTGRDLTPTPRGSFEVYRKMPSRYMQGPLPGISDQYYDLPGVPWNLYFTKEGGAIHGAYWHTEFGNPWSHGCVNLPLDTARKLYEWTPLGTSVIVQD